jgi:hypothetical protein
MQGCRQISTDLSEDEVFVLVEPYFEELRSFFGERLREMGLPARTKNVELSIMPELHDSARHFAGCSDTGKLIAVAPEIVELPESTFLAILSHEFGHAIDFLFPGKFALVREEIEMFPEIPKGEDRRLDEARMARSRQWHARDPYAVEKTADKIVELVTGNRIGYLGPCRLQAINRGVPRPKDLR